MAFPTDLATFTTVTTGSKQNSPSHLGLHNDLADTVEALETKVGVDSSAVTTSHDYLLRHIPIQAANVTMGGYKISNLGAPVATGDAVRKSDALLLDGTQAMTGNLNLGTNNIIGVVDPSNAQDAATKNYVDTGGTYHDVGVRAYLNVQQSNITNNTYTKVLLDTESYDLGSDFASNKFTVDVAGYYLINGQVTYNSVVTDKWYEVAIYKNGAALVQNYQLPALASTTSCFVSTIQLLADDDYIELYTKQNSGVDTPDVLNGTTYTYMEVFLLKRS